VDELPESVAGISAVYAGWSYRDLEDRALDLYNEGAASGRRFLAALPAVVADIDRSTLDGWSFDQFARHVLARLDGGEFEGAREFSAALRAVIRGRADVLPDDVEHAAIVVAKQGDARSEALADWHRSKGLPD
jgi:hypothetical protein